MVIFLIYLILLYRIEGFRHGGFAMRLLLVIRHIWMRFIVICCDISELTEPTRLGIDQVQSILYIWPIDSP